MKLQITSSTGRNFEITVNQENENHIDILGSDFYLVKNSLKNHGDTTDFCRNIGITECNVNIEINQETSDLIRYTIFPSRKKVKLIRTFEDFDVHFTGETWKKIEEWEMADGTLSQFTIAKKEL